MTLSVQTEKFAYPVYLERGALHRAGELFPWERKCLIVTDENIPSSYVEEIRRQCGAPSLFVLSPGEKSKTLSSYEAILKKMLEEGFTRTDCVVALGGGVVGDLAGFVAATYLRGVDFYNIPTTVLSQVDSSIGGKVAVNFGGLKNMVGAFYPPKGVLIDPDTLESLPQRQIANGLAESVKMAMTFDGAFFSLFETGDVWENMEKIIEKSLLVKKTVVEQDEKEASLRRVLNFGHTLAHAIESERNRTKDPLYHGECVALGMIPMCSPEAKERLLPVLEKLGLPTRAGVAGKDLGNALFHDKKMRGKDITLIRVDRVGSYRMENKPFTEFMKEVEEMTL